MGPAGNDCSFKESRGPLKALSRTVSRRSIPACACLCGTIEGHCQPRAALDLLHSGMIDNVLLVLAQLLSPGGHSKSLISRTTNDEMFKLVRKGIAPAFAPMQIK